MKALVNILTEVNFTRLRISIGIRYWEDAIVNGKEDTVGNLIPLRVKNNWCPTINLETGFIENWEIGKEARVHYKCCDDGEYWLIADDGFELKYPGYYVPKILDLTKEGFGDYVIMNINSQGEICNWNGSNDISDFLHKDK